MKTIQTLFIASLLFSLTANAQITKDFWLVGGSAYFDNSNVKNSEGKEIFNNTSILVSPTIGYFLFDKLAGGIELNFGGRFAKGDISSDFGYGIGPFVRYYILKPEKTINVLLEANYNYSTGFNQNSTYTTTYGFKVGPVIYFNSSVGLELLAKYQHSFNSYDSYTSNRLQFGIGLQVHLEREK